MATTSEQNTAMAAPPRGWWGRNWKRLIATVVLVPVLLAVGGYLLKFGPVLFSEPYKRALEAALTSPQLISQIGEPIKRSRWADWTPSGSVDNDKEHGEARFSFSVTGPKGKVDLSVVARQIESQWGFTSFDGTAPDDRHLNLLPEINKDVKVDTPKFNGADQNSTPPTVKDATPDQDVKIDLDLPGEAKPDKK